MPDVCALIQQREAIRNGQIDFVGIGRQFLADENYLTKIREEKEEDIRPCISCHLGCMTMGLWKDSGAVSGSSGTCALNPYTGNEKKYEVKLSEHPKHFAVIGGGIAGMEFALQAVKRGHTVDLYEKTDRLGGVFNEAAFFTFKEKDRELLQYYSCQIQKSSVSVHMNTEIKDLSALDADEIVVATGSSSTRRLNVPGSEHSVSALEFLQKGMESKDNVVIIGGGLTGCEMAYELAMQGKHPVIVEVMNDILIAPGSCMANTSYLRDAFDYYKVPVYVSGTTEKITEDAVEIVMEDGTHKVLPADTTVVSIGYINGIPFDMAESEHIHVIGDAEKVSNLLGAVKAANDLVITF